MLWGCPIERDDREPRGPSRSSRGGSNWYHTLDLGHGIRTPGVDDTPRKLETLHMPDDLQGQSVLDVGAWDGFFSFEAERRGARDVLATDSFCWSGEGWGSKEGFDLARQMVDSKVRDKEISVDDLSPQTVGVFDLVLLYRFSSTTWRIHSSRFSTSIR